MPPYRILLLSLLFLPSSILMAGCSAPAAASQHDAKSLLADALAYQKEGRLAEAEAIYRKVLAENPRNADARAGLGGIYLQTGREREAMELSKAGDGQGQ